MNLRFLKQLNEDHDKRMTSTEMQSYMELLYKKCNNAAKDEFNEYLGEECGVEDVDFAACCEILRKDKDRCDRVIHRLEALSEKLDESSLSMILKSMGDASEKDAE